MTTEFKLKSVFASVVCLTFGTIRSQRLSLPLHYFDITHLFSLIKYYLVADSRVVVITSLWKHLPFSDFSYNFIGRENLRIPWFPVVIIHFAFWIMIVIGVLQRYWIVFNLFLSVATYLKVRILTPVIYYKKKKKLLLNEVVLILFSIEVSVTCHFVQM